MSDHERHVPGYTLILPKSIVDLHHAQIVLLVREDLTVRPLSDSMDMDTATIWIKVGNSKKNSLVIGGIYRQHLVLGQVDTPASRLERLRLQEVRWENVVKKSGETSLETPIVWYWAI